MPANVEAVVWASAIPEPLSTVFELGALLFLIGRKPGWSRGLFISAILYGFATLTHESAILFPLIVAAYVFLFQGGKETTARIVAALRVCAPFAIVTIAYMCARLNALGLKTLFGVHYNITDMMIRAGYVGRPHHSLAEILMTLPAVMITYLAVLALPAMADATHAIEWITHPEPLVFISAGGFALLSAAAFVLAWRSSNRRIYLFCAAWGIFTMAPALNLNGLWWPAEDRFLYAPSFGWSLAVALAVVEIAASGARARKFVGAATALLLAAYALSTIQTEHYWHDDVTFFHRCAQIAPHDPNIHIWLAAAMKKAGDPDGAVQELERGASLNPDNALIHLKLAEQCVMMGRDLESQREFKKFHELSAAMIEARHAASSSSASQPAAAP